MKSNAGAEWPPAEMCIARSVRQNAVPSSGRYFIYPSATTQIRQYAGLLCAANSHACLPSEQPLPFRAAAWWAFRAALIHCSQQRRGGQRAADVACGGSARRCSGGAAAFVAPAGNGDGGTQHCCVGGRQGLHVRTATRPARAAAAPPGAQPDATQRTARCYSCAALARRSALAAGRGRARDRSTSPGSASHKRQRKRWGRQQPGCTGAPLACTM